MASKSSQHHQRLSNAKDLFEYLELKYQLPGASLFQYLSFRSALSFIFSLLLSIKYGKNIMTKTIDEILEIKNDNSKT